MNVYSRFWYNSPIPKSTHSNPSPGKARAKNAQKSPEHKLQQEQMQSKLEKVGGAIGRKQSCGFRRIFSVAFEWLF